MEPPETRYVKTPDGAHIAYQVFGDGPYDLVYVPGFASNVEYMWRIEPFVRGLRRLGSFARVVVFDRRGTGLSDRSQLPGERRRAIRATRVVRTDTSEFRAAADAESPVGE